MDGRIRTYQLLVILLLCITHLSSAQFMSWRLLSQDTLYYGVEYYPKDVHAASLGPAQIWDFRALKAPYSLTRQIAPIGERNGVSYGYLKNGKTTHAVVSLEDGHALITQRIEPNPLCENQKLTFQMIPPYPLNFKGKLGSKANYSGKRVSTFVWPRNVACDWNPEFLPDSVRLTYHTLENVFVDGDGTLYLPTEVKSVQRHRKSIKETLKVEVFTKGKWMDVTDQIPNLEKPGARELRVFVENVTGVPLVTLSLDNAGVVQSAEFKTHPLITRSIDEEPYRPDIFAYPNPSYDIVRFQLRDLTYGQYKLTIFNILGVPVKTITIPVQEDRKTVYVDLSDVKRGTYLYRLEDKHGESIRARKFTMITL